MNWVVHATQHSLNAVLHCGRYQQWRYEALYWKMPGHGGRNGLKLFVIGRQNAVFRTIKSIDVYSRSVILSLPLRTGDFRMRSRKKPITGHYYKQRLRKQRLILRRYNRYPSQNSGVPAVEKFWRRHCRTQKRESICRYEVSTAVRAVRGCVNPLSTSSYSVLGTRYYHVSPFNSTFCRRRHPASSADSASASSSSPPGFPRDFRDDGHEFLDSSRNCSQMV